MYISIFLSVEARSATSHATCNRPPCKPSEQSSSLVRTTSLPVTFNGNPRQVHIIGIQSVCLIKRFTFAFAAISSVFVRSPRQNFPSPVNSRGLPRVFSIFPPKAVAVTVNIFKKPAKTSIFKSAFR